MGSDEDIQEIEVYFTAIYLGDFPKWCPKIQQENHHFVSL